MNEINFGKIKALLFSSIKAVGSLHPDKVMSRFADELSDYEFGLVRSFLIWVNEELPARDFGRDSFQVRWLEWARQDAYRTIERGQSTHDPRVAVTLIVTFKVAVDFAFFHETVNHAMFNDRVAELVNDRIAAGGGVQANEIEHCEVIKQEAL